MTLTVKRSDVADEMSQSKMAAFSNFALGDIWSALYVNKTATQPEKKQNFMVYALTLLIGSLLTLLTSSVTTFREPQESFPIREEIQHSSASLSIIPDRDCRYMWHLNPIRLVSFRFYFQHRQSILYHCGRQTFVACITKILFRVDTPTIFILYNIY